MIKLEALRVFVTVAEAGNIKDASEQLGRTASAISMALKQLEQEIGGPLFETDRKNALTALGAFMLETGRTQILSYDKAIATIRAFAQNRIGHLTIACVPSVAANIVPSLLSRFVADRPEVEVELFDIDSRNVRRMVEAGTADIGIAGQPGLDVLVAFEPLFRDRFKVICGSAGHMAQLGRPIDWSDLETEMLILNGASQKISAPEYQALSGRASITVRNVTSLIALTKSGPGVTLLPSLTATDLPDGVVALDLADIRAERVVGLITRRGAAPSPVAQAFRQLVLCEITALIEPLGLERAELS